MENCENYILIGYDKILKIKRVVCKCYNVVNGYIFWKSLGL